MTTASKPTVKAIHKDGYPPTYKQEVVFIDKKQITSKRRLTKMMKELTQHRGRKHNHVINERRRKHDLLRRDIMRLHNTPRVRAALKRAAKETQ